MWHLTFFSALLAIVDCGAQKLSIQMPQPSGAESLFDGKSLEGSFDQSFEVGDDGKRFLLIREPEEEDPTELILVFNWLEELQETLNTAE